MKGEIVSVVPGGTGPRCCIETPEGLRICGARVPDSYAPFEHEVVYRGRCVRWRGLDGVDGAVVFDGDGRQQKHKDANGWSFSTFQIAAVWEVRDAEPPALLPPIVRGEYLPHRDVLTGATP